MKKYLLSIGLILGFTGLAHATCTSGGDPCNQPRTATITGHTATTISLQVQNSATPNTTSSIYFFQATTLGSAQTNGTPDRNTVIVFTADFANPALPGDLIGQTVRPLLASASYNTFSKACPPGSSLPTDAGCSAWVSIGAQTTDALTNAGFNNIAAADTQIQQLVARTNGSIVDQTNVIAWLATSLTSTEVGNCTFTNSVQPFPASGTTSMTIDSGDCSTLTPNRPYRLVEHLVYDPTQSAPNFTSGVFYTKAQDPVAVTPITGITHCSATLPFQNAAANPTNPADTNYTVTIGGAVSSGAATRSAVIGGATPSTQNSVTFNTLIPGTHYTPSVIANNRGGAPWLNSNSISYAGGFTTSGTAGTFGIANVATTSADFTFSGLDLSGVTGYQMIVNGANFGAQVNSVPVSPIHLAGLSANVQYTIQIQLFEASCSFTVPQPGTTFTSDAAAPANFVLTAPNPNTLHAVWTDGVNVGANTAYQFTYCTNAAMTTACQSVTTAKGVLNANGTVGVNPATTYFGQVRALTVGGGANSAYIPVPPASVTTPPDNSTITVTPNPVTVAQGQTQTFSARVTDFTGTVIPGATVQWTLSAPAAGSLGASPAATVVYTAGATNGNFSISATKPGYTTGTASITVVPFLTIASIKVCASGDMACAGTITVQALQTQNFTATCLDQFGAAIQPCVVTWSTSGGNVSQAGVFNSPTLGQKIIVSATSGSIKGAINVNIVNFDVSGAHAFPVPYKASMGTGVIHFVGLGTQATLHIYTTSGRRVFDYSSSADTFDWQIKNNSGESIASGVYFFVIESPQGKKNGKLIIIQ